MRSVHCLEVDGRVRNDLSWTWVKLCRLGRWWCGVAQNSNFSCPRQLLLLFVYVCFSVSHFRCRDEPCETLNLYLKVTTLLAHANLWIYTEGDNFVCSFCLFVQSWSHAEYCPLTTFYWTGILNPILRWFAWLPSLILSVPGCWWCVIGSWSQI